MALLPAEPFYFGNRHALYSDSGQGIPDIIQPKWLDYSSDKLHEHSPVQSVCLGTGPMLGSDHRLAFLKKQFACQLEKALQLSGLRSAGRDFLTQCTGR